MNMYVFAGRFFVCLVSLGSASIQDFSTREVCNWVWVLSLPVCLLLDGLDLYLGSLLLSDLVASLGLSLLVGVALFYLGFFGGADVKALLLIASALPSYGHVPQLLLARVLFLPLIFVFFSATVLSALYPVSILLLNLNDLRRGRHLLQGVEVKRWLGKLALYATVRRVNLEKLRKSLKYLPAEKVMLEDGQPVRRPVYFVSAEADVDVLFEKLEAHGELFREGVLASPTIPMIVFLTVGFVSAGVVAVLSFV